jgi:subtilisin family serine protease
MPSEPQLDTAAFELRARATAVGSVGTDGLWHVAKPTGVLSLGGSGASGAGVIVGVIDTGIDVSHPAFCSAQWSPGHASSRTSLRPRFVRVPVRGGGRESNPPEQGRCSHRF